MTTNLCAEFCINAGIVQVGCYYERYMDWHKCVSVSTPNSQKCCQCCMEPVSPYVTRPTPFPHRQCAAFNPVGLGSPKRLNSRWQVCSLTSLSINVCALFLWTDMCAEFCINAGAVQAGCYYVGLTSVIWSGRCVSLLLLALRGAVSIVWSLAGACQFICYPSHAPPSFIGSVLLWTQ